MQKPYRNQRQSWDSVRRYRDALQRHLRSGILCLSHTSKTSHRTFPLQGVGHLQQSQHPEQSYRQQGRDALEWYTAPWGLLTALPFQHSLQYTGLQSKLPLSRGTTGGRKARSTSERYKEYREELQHGIKLRQNTKLNTGENCAMVRAVSYTFIQMEGWFYLFWTG